MDEHDRELFKCLVLGEFENALFYLRNCPEAHEVLKSLLGVPGNDPMRDSRAIIFRWSIECFLNRIGAKKFPNVPIDFSSIHPELNNDDVIMTYSKTSPGDLLRLVETFPYELYKTIGAMKGSRALDFLIGCATNESISCHLVGRFLSMFPMAELQFNYPDVLFERRCKVLSEFEDLFEGLMCNSESKQVISAQYLAAHFDSVLGDSILQFLNQCVRAYQHFIDKNLALTIHLFPECITLTFLLQAEVSPMSSLSPLLKRLPPSHFVTRFKNQIALMQVCGVSDDWSKLNQVSVPKLLDFEMVYSGFLNDFPREAIFVTLSSKSWEVDYDFLKAMLVFRTVISGNEVPEFDPEIAVDIFSLLFAKTYRGTRRRKRSSSMNSLNEKPGSAYDDLSDAVINCSGKFIISFEYSDKLIKKLAAMENISGVLKTYVHRAKIKFEAVKLLFDKPTIHMAFVPPKFLYARALNSPSVMEKLIRVYGQPPAFAQSKMFSQKLAQRLDISSRENNVSVFGSRKRRRLKEVFPIVNEFLQNYPEDRHSLFLLDFASSFSGFAGLSRKCNSHEPFVSHIQKHELNYPTSLDISPQGCTIPDYETKLKASIAKFRSKTGVSQKFCLYLRQILTQESPTLSKLLSQRPVSSIIAVLNKIGSIDTVRNSLLTAGVHLLPVLYAQPHSEKQLTQSLVLEIVKRDPLPGIPYAWSSVSLLKLSQLESISVPLRKYIQHAHLRRKARHQKTEHSQHEERQKLDILRHRVTQTLISEILQSIKSADPQEIIDTLEDLMYRYSLERHVDTVIELIKSCPLDRKKQFLESLISLMPDDSDALMSLSRVLSSLCAIGDEKEGDDEELIARDCNYVMRKLSTFRAIFDSPEKAYSLTMLHLKWHRSGIQFMVMCQHLCRILIYERASKIFSSSDEEVKWVQQFLGEDFSKLSEHSMVAMAVDVMLTFCVGRETASEISHSKEFVPVLLERLPESIVLLNYIENADDVVGSILTSLQIDSAEKEQQLLKMLWRMNSVAETNTLWKILKKFCEYGFYTRYYQTYTAQNLSRLRDQAELFDIHEALCLFDDAGVLPTPIVSQMITDGRMLLGLTPNNVGEKRTLFQNDNVPFSIDITSNPSSDLSSLYAVEVVSGSIAVSKVTTQKQRLNVSSIRVCDLPCYDISSVCILDNPGDSSMTTMISYSDSNTTPVPENIIESGDIFEVLTKSIAGSGVLELFPSCSLRFLHEVVTYANDHSLLFLLFHLTTWAIPRPHYYPIFLFENKSLENEAEMRDFLVCLKETIASAAELTDYISSSLLLPPHVLIKGQKAILEDYRMVIKHQIEIGVEKLSLFDPGADKAKTLSKLFVANDFERGFALARILHVDIDSVMIEACAVIGQSSNEDLAGFLFGVLPHLEPESANRLIEALAVILGRSSEKDKLVNLLVSGFGDKKNVYRMLRWFGSLEHASLLALDGGFRHEIEESNKEAKKRKNEKLLRQTSRWLLQHH